MQKGPPAYAATLFRLLLFIFLPVFGEAQVVS